MEELATGAAVFVIIWVLVLFMALPWGNQPIEQEEIDKGFASSAPAKPRILLKMAVTTAITIVLWFGYDFLASSGWISFRQ